MPRYATETEHTGGFKPGFGTHNVVCCGVVDFGTQDHVWEGKVQGQNNPVNLTFEFVDVTLQGDSGEYHPIWGFNINNTLGNSGKPSRLRTLLEGWRGRAFTEDEKKGFDISKLIGLPCTLVVQGNQKGNPKVVAISKCATKLEGKRELKTFIMDEDWDRTIPEDLPEWMQEEIKKSYEYRGVPIGGAEQTLKGNGFVEQDVTEDEFDDSDSIPF